MNWICQRCGTSYAPFVRECGCPPPTVTTTSTFVPGFSVVADCPMCGETHGTREATSDCCDVAFLWAEIRRLRALVAK